MSVFEGMIPITTIKSRRHLSPWSSHYSSGSPTPLSTCIMSPMSYPTEPRDEFTRPSVCKNWLTITSMDVFGWLI